MLRSYQFKGVCLESEFEFPELQPCANEPQVRLLAGKLARPELKGPLTAHWTQVRPDETYFVWEGLGLVRVREGREITVDVGPEASLPLLHAGLLGPVFSVLCAQRGLLPLHASSVLFGAVAILLSGPSGAGKSSLAAGLCGAGHALIADDVSTIEVEAGAAVVHRGLSRLRLTDATRQWSGLTADALQLPLCSGDDLEPKHHCAVEGVAGARPTPLARLYMIAEGPEPRVERLGAQESFLALAQNVHRPELVVGTLGQEGFMERCAELARCVPIFRLTRPQHFERLHESLRLLEEHAG